MLKNYIHYKKVQKLLTALRNALECGNAIVFMLSHYIQTRQEFLVVGQINME